MKLSEPIERIEYRFEVLKDSEWIVWTKGSLDDVLDDFFYHKTQGNFDSIRITWEHYYIQPENPVQPAVDWYCLCREPAPDRLGTVAILRPASISYCHVCFMFAPWANKD